MNHSGKRWELAGDGSTPVRTKGLVSIIVPVFNGEKYIRESLDSIVSQTYLNVEILVMDDASTDGTADILREYAELGRLRVLRQAGNRGIYQNANDGIAMSQGEFIAVYHADDVYSPMIVEREVRFLNEYPEAGAVFTNMDFIGPDSREYGQLMLPPEVRGGRPLDFATVFNALLTNRNAFLMCPTAMIRASVHESVGVYNDTEFRNTADLEMWLRISKHCAMGVLEERLLRYRHFHESSSLKYHRLRTEPGRFFRIMDLFLSQGASALASPRSMAAYEAHRAEDLLITSATNYILDRRAEALELLRRVGPHRILAHGVIQRGRMFMLYLILHALVRMPVISPVQRLFRRRWHEKTVPVAKRKEHKLPAVELVRAYERSPEKASRQ